MTEKQKEIDRHDALETLLERAAESERKEGLQLSQSVEEGSIHPSIELLREYAAGLMDEEDTVIMANHMALCGSCSERLLRIQYIENAPKSIVQSWIEKAKSLFPVFVRPVSALGFAERGDVQDAEPSSYVSGTEVILMLEAHADGYLTIFHECEETGRVELLFPLETKYVSPVSGGQEIWPITRTVQGPPGKHWFTVFWTRVPVIDPAAYQLEDAEERERASADFFEALEGLREEDVAAGTQEYMVIME
jgi:hypothetical protein